MRVPFNDLKLHHELLQPALRDSIEAAISSSAFIRGPEVDAFEKEFAGLLGVKHCVSCANGTDALYICMRGLGLQPGDEVITTAHTWIASSETITQAGGRVVFADTDFTTFTIDPQDVARKITARTKGIIAVHLYGQACDLAPLLELARKHKLWLIEDCAQSHLATYRGQMVGTFGDAATFSFYPGKNLGAMGDAGALVTNRDDLAEWSTLFARHGGKGDHKIEGINSRMDGIQGSVLRVKLPHLQRWTEARRKAAAYYDARLAGIGDIVTPAIAPGRDHVYHLYVIRTARRDGLRQHLTASGIETVLNYPKALPFYAAYAHLGHKPADFPNAYANQGTILSLPIYPEITEAQLDYVVRSVAQFFAQA
ncbi:MAG: DegT/DnrJ/EryC1/StrS family aminotransferase [Opitutae bacterium]|nr:DegT/DnrJ/EryC1/StrS family aminotransferase [Opitutae bacterium]